MIKFKSNIAWVKPNGGVEKYSADYFYHRCLKACYFFKRCPAHKFVILWESSLDAAAMFVGGLMANKMVGFYSIPNFKLNNEYFKMQLAAVKEQGLTTVGSPKYSHLNLDHIFDFKVSAKRIKFNGSYSMDFMQFSSGTTGIRKRISYRGGSLIKYIDEYSEAIGITEKSVIASWVPHYHDLGLIYGILLPLVKGCDIIGMSNLDWIRNPDVFVEACVKHGASFLVQPNFAYSLMSMRCKKEDLSFMKFYSAGEVVSNEDCKKFEKKFNAKIYGSWGLAETIMCVTASQDTTGDLCNVRNSGKPFADTRVKIINGEIALKSGYLFSGYDTGESIKMSDGWYHTGDRGVIKEGLLYVMGRTDESFKVNGQKVIPELAEMEINRVDGVKKGRVACFGVKNKQGGNEAVLLYEGTIPNNDLIRSAVNLNINVCKKVPYGWLVKSSSGKISRKYCKEKYLKTIESV